MLLERRRARVASPGLGFLLILAQLQGCHSAPPTEAREEVHPREDLLFSHNTDIQVHDVALSESPPITSDLEPLAYFDADAAVGHLDSESQKEDDPLVFGTLLDALVDSIGNVLLLDQDYGIVRAFDKHLVPTHTIGRLGDGPGEFVQPEALHWLSSRDFAVFDADAHRLEQFGRAGGNWEVSGRIPLLAVPRADDACAVDNHIYVKGVSLTLGTVAVTPADVHGLDLGSATVVLDGFMHELDAEGGILRSFSMPYQQFVHPTLAIYFTEEGGLECWAGRLWVGYGPLGEVHAFRATGAFEWITRITDLHHPGFRYEFSATGELLPRSGGLNVDAADVRSVGYSLEWIHRLTLLSPEVLAVSVKGRTIGPESAGYPETLINRTYLLDPATGGFLGAFVSNHEVLGGGHGRAVLYREEPYPQVVLVDLR